MKFRKMLFSVIAMLGTICGLTACSSENDANANKEYVPGFEFVATGKTGGARDEEFQPLEGQDFTVTIKSLENNEVELSVKEAPQINIGGTYEYVDGKGYKIYLEDVHETFVYTNYDVSSKTFSFNTCIVFNISIGYFDGNFSYVDEAFAAKYDNVGFDIHAPVFEGAVSVMPGGKCLLKTDDKGNFVWFGISGMGGDYAKRYGTWRYDSAADEYVFNFTDPTFTKLATLWMTVEWSDANIETFRGGDRSGLQTYPDEAKTDITAFNAYLESVNYFKGEVRAPKSTTKDYYYLNFAMMNVLGTDLTSGAPGWAWATYTPAK